MTPQMSVLLQLTRSVKSYFAGETRLTTMFQCSVNHDQARRTPDSDGSVFEQGVSMASGGPGLRRYTTVNRRFRHGQGRSLPEIWIFTNSSVLPAVDRQYSCPCQAMPVVQCSCGRQPGTLNASVHRHLTIPCDSQCSCPSEYTWYTSRQ